MDPVGSWSAYAASYNRLTNTGGIQNGPSSELLAGSNCGQGVPSSTPQLLLQAHAGSTMPTASPFTSTGFLSPPPVAYDGVFTPIFHQKAHYGSFQHRSSLKQSSEQDYNQLATVSSNFFDQPTAWSQSNPQLPSPFGILPHESVIPDASAKPYDNVNHYVQLQSLNQHNSQINTAFAEPKKQTQLVSTPKTSPAFFQQPVISDSSYKYNDYSPRLSYGHIQQPCALQAAGPPKEYRVPHSSRILFDHSSAKTDYGVALSKVTAIQAKKGYDSSERGLDSDCQSSPISYAMMDTQRGFQSTKSRSQQYHQVNDEQSCRFNSELDYRRKTNDSYSPNESSDCAGVTRRSPSGHSASPVYPMYNSPMTTISSPSPNQHDVCYSKQTSEGTVQPPLDVSFSHNNIPFSSVITRSEKNYIDDRFDRDEINKLQWDERQRRYGAYEAPNIQRSYEDPNQVCLQDLSSCRGDPMSLVKTLQQQVPDKYPDDRMKITRINQESACSRIPPPAHHNANNLNQNSYFEFDRWNISTTGKVFSATPVTLSHPQASSNLSSTFTGQHQPQSAALVVPHHGPPLSYLPAFHVPQTHPTITPSEAEQTTPPLQSTTDSSISSNRLLEQPQRLPETTSPPPPLQIQSSSSNKSLLSPPPHAADEQRQLPSSPKNNCPRTTVVVPDIEDELSFLADENELEGDFKYQIPITPSAKYQDTYIKFIEGKNDGSPKVVSRLLKKSSYLKVKQITEINDIIIKKTFPSDPQDDPRYYPLPKSVERSFETSDSEKEPFYEIVSKDKEENDKKKNDEHSCVKSISQENIQAKNKKKKETNKNLIDTSTDSIKESEIVNISSASSHSSEPKRKRREQPRRVSKSNLKSSREKDSVNSSENSSNSSDSDWQPDSDNDKRRRRLRKRVREDKEKTGNRASRNFSQTSFSSTSDDYSDAENCSNPQKVVKKKFIEKNVPAPEFVSLGEIDTGNKYPISDVTSKKPELNEKDSTKNPIEIEQEKLIENTEDTVNKNKPNSCEIGQFLVNIYDRKFYYPPLWLVKENSTLQKHLHSVNIGSSLYKSVPSYTTLRPEANLNTYERINLEVVSQTRGTREFRLVTRNLLKIQSREGRILHEKKIRENQKYKKNFEIYIQALISRVLDPNFLTKIIEEKDHYYLNSIKEIDTYCADLKERLKLAINSITTLVSIIEELPSYSPMVTNGQCICGIRGYVAVALEGTSYNEQTLQGIEESRKNKKQQSKTTTVLCRMCFEFQQILHRISHFKLYTYAICARKVQLKMKENSEHNNSTIVSGLLQDNEWLSKVFLDSCKFWGYVNKIIYDYT